ncbi:hypothetical protein TRFO_26984 [Tritrichomonas foetus]|uniref:Uncharacterized protein n=1 Tax=Tritrichomonas foetus TaxID=1144522 RepID=A0A1J4K6E9_9EUKA|nr:hypothetical protein TRFO_26984 [Tritrichomonas foetus]|eukprot:OHT05292.1 hypothetical protein TRFO_26984 [Tritrichomonas foetus]
MHLSGQGIFKYTLPPPSSTKLPGVVCSSPRRRPTRVSTPASIHPPFDNKYNRDVENLVIRALRGENISDCDPDLLPDVIQKLNDQWNFLNKNGFHREAEEALCALKAAKAVRLEIQRKQFQQKIQKELSSRAQEANTELEKLNEKSTEIEKNMDYAFQNDIDELKYKHQKEIDAFNFEWMTSKQKMYNKTSNELKELRRQQDLYIDQKLFKDSELCKKRADSIELNEIQKASEQMEFDYQLALKPIFLHQQEEMKNLLKAQKHEKRVYQSIVKSEMDLLNQRIQKIENEYEKTKDMRYITRRHLQSSKEYGYGYSNRNKILPTEFTRSAQKDVINSELNEIPLGPLNFAKKVEQTTSKRSYIRSPRSNAAKRIISGH